ncbi:Cytochrome P450 [Penicillium cf. griseofulvum]|uniref:Cytochrome P450 n=1 Tax=Penicillium cf. griseofulvum TaxID=2972120 RepID=A0A9W9ME56_9EURO|nr:Cytochrome P450 [Penicillium cf. griseofulvum]KAJ5451122.1 Cytochrome P450 [Penicillium cf. griseofulvum]
MVHFSFNISEYLLLLVYAVLSYNVVKVIYRLYFSPLAGFPGPRLAAVTSLYEFYFDVLKGGQFMFEINRLHAKYGPIVRINPRELHIKDPSFYDTLYGGPVNKRDKDFPFIKAGMPLSAFETAPHDLHRERRKLLSPFLSTQAVTGLQPVVQEKMDLVCSHLSRRVGTGEFLDMHALFASFAADILSAYVHGRENCYGYLDNAEISDEWKKNINNVFEGLLFLRHLPFTLKPGRMFPNITSWLFPTFSGIHQIETKIHQSIKAAYRNPTEKSIISTVLSNEKVPDHEKEFERLKDELQFLLLAGTDAPSQAMAITMFHLLWNPETHKKLKDELDEAFPILSDADWNKLKNLPYLTAVLKEGLRLSAIVTTRLPRIAPDEALRYGKWTIPPGTPVGMTTHSILRDPEVYTEPMKFIPERWLGPPEEVRVLDRYLVPFAKGNSSCMGQSMAYSWLYAAIGTAVRKFQLELHETDEKNVRIVRDCFNGQTVPGLNVINVKVVKEFS